MNRIAMRALCVLSILLAGAPAQAQLFRAYLASYGTDANPCTLAAPCRLLPRALAVVTSGGEIWMLDSANYNTAMVTISKSVSIAAVPGQLGSVVSPPLQYALSVTGSLGVTVGLRNIAITSLATDPGWSGVGVGGTDTTLSVENCSFTDLPNRGIEAAGNSVVHVKDSIFRNLGSAAVAAFDGPVVDISRSRFFRTQAAAVASSSTAVNTKVSVSDSMISEVPPGTAVGQLAAQALAAGGAAKLYVTRTTVHDAATALYANAASGATASVYVRGSSLVGNLTNVYITGSGAASVYSLGDNVMAASTYPDVGSVTPLASR